MSIKCKKILVLGAIYVDVIVNVNELPLSGEDVTGNLRTTTLGGSAYNAQCAIQYSGGQSDLFAPVGQGIYSDIIQKEFNERHIEIMVKDDSKDNGWVLSMIEKNGQRTFLTIHGVEQSWKESWLGNIDLSEYGYFYISGYQLENDQISFMLINHIKNKHIGAKVLFDASPRVKYLSKETLSRILVPGTIVHCNEEEAKVLVHKNVSYQEAARILFDKTGEPVVITLGNKGVYCFDGKNNIDVCGEKVVVVNTLGAGDSHCGTFLVGLQRGMGLYDSLSLANHVSAKVVSQLSGAIGN